MTRIIAGAARGRRLAVPPGRKTRPTAERAREGLFSTLSSLLGTLSGTAVLDLYAGSGAVGLEARSRGADRVLLVESDPKAVRTIRANLESVHLGGVEVHAGPVERLVATAPTGEAFRVAFLDPPYEIEAARVSAVLASLRDNHWLAPGAVVALERGSRDEEWTWPTGFTADRVRRYGEATIWYGRAAEPPTDG